MSDAAELSFSRDCMQLAGTLDFATVIQLQEAGDNWLRDEAPVACRLDMSGVTRSNSAGTALLLAWLRTASASGKSLRVQHVPENLQSLMELAGLDKVLSNDTQ